MKITRRQLLALIQESLLEQDAAEEVEQPVEKADIDLEIGLGDESPVSLKLRMNSDGKTEAYVKNDETGATIEKYDDASNEKTKQDLFGWLRVGLEDAKDRASKMKISQAISRLLGDSEDEADAVANLEKHMADTGFASYAQNVRKEKKHLSNDTTSA